jgi:hypothetical protein
MSVYWGSGKLQKISLWSKSGTHRQGEASSTDLCRRSWAAQTSSSGKRWQGVGQAARANLRCIVSLVALQCKCILGRLFVQGSTSQARRLSRHCGPSTGSYIGPHGATEPGTRTLNGEFILTLRGRRTATTRTEAFENGRRVTKRTSPRQHRVVDRLSRDERFSP